MVEWKSCHELERQFKRASWPQGRTGIVDLFLYEIHLFSTFI
jgi:hypothetical protein